MSPSRVHRLVPILNVSDMEGSFAWFAKLGRRKGAVGRARDARPATLTATPSASARPVEE